ncbi:hypothetical protein AB0C34_07975 [Nocardia sp. NPDC049220]|uniref:hypothetical protein n=1 Tax=Nocardia sp. NPDC049220 TaxID=3155273 RepID=UPI0034010D29
MPTAISEAIARQQLHQYFIETLRRLPRELSLSRSNPAVPRAEFTTGITLPCDDGDAGPKYFDIRYWLIGVTPATSDTHFDLVVTAWASMRWPTGTDRAARPRAAFCRTPDHYGLTIQQSVDGHLSLSGSTPPFLTDATGGEPLPASIAHP